MCFYQKNSTKALLNRSTIFLNLAVRFSPSLCASNRASVEKNISSQFVRNIEKEQTKSEME